MPVMEDRIDDAPTEQDVVRCHNQGKDTFVGKWAGRRFYIEPGEMKFVPFYAMCLWAGHPNARDISKRERYRTDEWQRLQVRYGTYSFNGCWTFDVCDGNPTPDGSRKKHPPRRHLPDIHFYSIDTDTEYNTVLIDPEGTKTGHAVAPDETLADDVVRQLREEVANLQHDLAVVQASQGAVDSPLPARDVDIEPSPSGVQSVTSGVFDAPKPVDTPPTPKKKVPVE